MPVTPTIDAPHNALGEAKIAAEIDLQHIIPVIILHLDEQFVARDAGIGDEDVERPYGGLCAAHKTIYGVSIGQIARHDGALALQRACDLLKHVLACARQRNFCACL